LIRLIILIDSPLLIALAGVALLTTLPTAIIWFVSVVVIIFSAGIILEKHRQPIAYDDHLAYNSDVVEKYVQEVKKKRS